MKKKLALVLSVLMLLCSFNVVPSALLEETEGAGQQELTEGNALYDEQPVEHEEKAAAEEKPADEPVVTAPTVQEPEKPAAEEEKPSEPVTEEKEDAPQEAGTPADDAAGDTVIDDVQETVKQEQGEETPDEEASQEKEEAADDAADEENGETAADSKEPSEDDEEEITEEDGEEPTEEDNGEPAEEKKEEINEVSNALGDDIPGLDPNLGNNDDGSLANAYAVTIPSGIVLDPDTLEGNVTIRAAGVGSNQTIAVVMRSENNFSLVSGNNKLAYTVSSSDRTFKSGDTVYEFTADGSFTLSVKVTEKPTQNGTYTDRISFSLDCRQETEAQND